LDSVPSVGYVAVAGSIPVPSVVDVGLTWGPLAAYGFWLVPTRAGSVGGDGPYARGRGRGSLLALLRQLRERSIRMTLDARQDPASRPSACRRIGEQLGINPETLRGWVTQAEVDAGARPGTTTAEAARLGELEREVRELRRANAILLSASVFFAAALDRPSR
jgi:transposase